MARHAERGAALALVLWALVVGGALVTAAIVVTVQEQRMAGAEGRDQRAFLAAEQHGTETLDRWTAGELLLRMPQPFDSLQVGNGPGWAALVRRLTGKVFLLEVEAAAQPDAARRMGWLIQAEPESIALAGAVSVGGRAFLGDGVTISGVDEPPPGRGDCPPASAAIAGVSAAGTDVVGSATIAGSPPMGLRSAAESGLAGVDLAHFDDFATRAARLLPPGSYSTHPATVGTVCDLRDALNWGDPSGPPSPCGTYFPVVRIAGGGTLTGGVGQGILLVDGDLRITAPYEFDGLILVRGTIETQDHLLVRGAIAAPFLGSPAGHLTQVEVHYSKCIIDNVLEFSSPLQVLASRGWKQLFRAP